MALSRPWFGNVFTNPPGDQRGVLVKAFWRRACRYVIFGPPDAAVPLDRLQHRRVAALHACEPFEDGTPCPGPLAWPFVLIGPQGPGTTGGGRICWISGESGLAGQTTGPWQLLLPAVAR